MRLPILVSLLLILCTSTFAQVQTADTSIKVVTIMNVQPNAVRVAWNTIDNSFYYCTFDGGFYKIKSNGSAMYDSLVASSSQTNINYLQGMAFVDSTVYLVGNRKRSNSTGYGLVIRGRMLGSGSWTWDTIMKTANYQSTATLYDHAFSSICVSPGRDSLYIGSGSRTDHGEIQTSNGLFPNTREVPLTTAIFRIPRNPSSTIFLPNDSAALSSSPWIYCRGVRNAFDLALAPNGDLIAAENTGDRDDPEELNWIRQGQNYGFPWRMGGNLTPMQFAGYNANNDKLINHNCLGWGNGTTTNRFYNDPTYPQAPSNIVFTEPIRNYGPDADKFRDPITGGVKDASDLGTFITSFTSHRSPLGIVFDTQGQLAPPYRYSGFLLSYTTGTLDSSGTLPGSTGPFCDLSQDLLQLSLFKDTLDNSYKMNCYKTAWNFLSPVDAFLKNNELYVLESHSASNPIPAKLYKITFPSYASSLLENLIGKDTSICAGTPLTITPKLNGFYQYLWSTGATTKQITVQPGTSTTFWLRARNGIVEITDTIVVTVKPAPLPPASITVTGGSTKVCPGDSRYYAVTQVTGTNYTWTVPSGAVIMSGQGSRKISVAYTSSFMASGNVTVTATNSCGTSIPKTALVNMNMPLIPTIITGNKNGVCGLTGQSYSVSSVAGMTYQWDVPLGATLVSGQGTNSVVVNFPATNFTGDMVLFAENTCGISPVRTLAVKAFPATPTSITGPSTVCANNSYSYSISALFGATTYTWQAPSGSTITANGTTSTSNLLTTSATAVTVNYGNTVGGQVLKVRGNNSCANGYYISKTLAACGIRSVEGANEGGFSVYPNPAEHTFTLSWEAMATNQQARVRLINILGEVLLDSPLNLADGSIQVMLDKGTPAGIYMVVVEGEAQQWISKIVLR